LKPLSEWTRDELLVAVYESHPHAQSALAELLRRERAKCLGVVESVEQTIRAFLLDATDAEMRYRLADKLSVVGSIRDAMRKLQ
jgi:predicted nuclease with RNAse H fold